MKWLVLVLALACGGVIQSDPLPQQRPTEPYLCVRNVGGMPLAVYTSAMPGRLMTVNLNETTCRALPLADGDLSVGFQTIAGPLYITPIPFRSSTAPCWFVEVGLNLSLSLANIRPCIER